MTTFLKDCTYAIHTLLERSGFALTVILTLALGIGANTAIFSVLKAVLLDSLPFTHSGQLVSLAQRNGDTDANPTTIGYPTFLDWQKLPAFSAIGVSSSWQPNLAADASADLLNGQSVSRDFFNVLGVTPQLGRLFSAEEDQPDRNDVVVLSAALWQRRFNANPDVLGQRLKLGSRTYAIVGVLPASFSPLVPAMVGRPPDIWRPLGYDLSKPYACRTCLHLQAIARLADGVDLPMAQAQLNRLTPALIKDYSTEYPADMRFEAHSLRDAVTGSVSRSLWMLFAGVSLVLLIVCTDIASLMLLRANSRKHELSVRAALGAQRGRLMRLMLAESVVLGSAGGALGSLLALAITRAITRLGPTSIPRLDSVQVDAPVLIFATALTIAVTLATGMWPAHRASRQSAGDALNDSGRLTIGPATGRIQTGLVVAQIALACALTLGALLTARSFSRLQNVESGFSAANIITMNVAIVGPRYRDVALIPQFLQQLEEQVRALPGVDRVGSVSPLPLSGGFDRAGFHIKDRPIAGPDAPEYDRTYATPGYFSTLQIPLISGRVFDATDRSDQPLVAVVSESLEHRTWPGQSAIGKQIQLGGRDDNAAWYTIVGVVGDVHQRSLDIEAAPQVYLDHAQGTDFASYMTLAIHTTLPDASIAQQVRSIAHALDIGVPVYSVQAMDQLVADSLARRRFLMLLFGLFAATALGLSALGIYGVMAHSVESQMRAFGLRRALGARDGSLIAWISAQSLRYLLSGLALGLPLALLWGRFLADELYGVSQTDSVSIALLLVTLGSAVVIATFAPVRRALRADPMIALRHE